MAPAGAIVATPLGVDLEIACSERAVVASRWVRRRSRPRRSVPRGCVLSVALEQARAYFARRLAVFDVPLELHGSPFSIEVWTCVAALRWGEAASYADVARAVGRPQAYRGVAQALAHTPLALYVPAHRVVGADGRVKGSSASSMRRRLLAFEGMSFQ